MNRVLFISEEMNFAIGSMRTALEDMDYEVVMVKPLISTILSEIEKVDLLILSISGMDDNAALNLMVLLKDQCIDKNKHIIPFGDKEELYVMQKNLPDISIVARVEKPFQVDVFKKTMDRALDKISNENTKKKILVIDDNITSLVKTQKLLEEKYNVMIASSAMKGIISLSRSTPDLILIDYMMPICDGRQCLSMIRHEAETETIPVIFLTSVKEMEKVKDAIKEKPDGYLLKDMPAKEFRSYIDCFFKNKGIGMDDVL